MNPSESRPLADWINLKIISFAANTLLFAGVLYLFLNYYGITQKFFPFIINKLLEFFVWIYLSINIVAVNFFEWLRRNKIKKNCPHCNGTLMVNTYKCAGCLKVM